MVDKTLTSLVTSVQKNLYQVAGVAVQIYSEDLLAEKIQNAFHLIHADKRWKRFHTFATYTLDGTTGRVTATVTDTFKTFEDIYKIYAGSSDIPLRRHSSERNPSAYSGSSPLEYVADRTTGKVFRVIPITSTGSITVVGRIGYTDDFALDDVVPFDHLALIYMTCWQWSVDDGTNSAMADKFQGLFETRIKQLTENQANEPISLNAGVNTRIPDSWEEW